MHDIDRARFEMDQREASSPYESAKVLQGTPEAELAG
jgi:hypothetical protein